MLHHNPIKTDTYTYDKNYNIDIVTDFYTYHAWIYNPSYGIKCLMFGVPKEQQSYQEFLEIVEANAPDYIESYQLDVED